MIAVMPQVGGRECAVGRQRPIAYDGNRRRRGAGRRALRYGPTAGETTDHTRPIHINISTVEGAATYRVGIAEGQSTSPSTVATDTGAYYSAGVHRSQHTASLHLTLSAGLTSQNQRQIHAQARLPAFGNRTRSRCAVRLEDVVTLTATRGNGDTSSRQL